MTRRRASGWPFLGLQTLSLANESARVANLRTQRIAQGGPDAWLESWLMISEKWQAAAELQATLMLTGTGASPETVTRKTLTHYRRKVAANRRRLAR